MKRNKPIVKHRKGGTQWRRRWKYRWSGGRWQGPGKFCANCWVRHSGDHCPVCTVKD